VHELGHITERLGQLLEGLAQVVPLAREVVIDLGDW